MGGFSCLLLAPPLLDSHRYCCEMRDLFHKYTHIVAWRVWTSATALITRLCWVLLSSGGRAVAALTVQVAIWLNLTDSTVNGQMQDMILVVQSSAKNWDYSSTRTSKMSVTLICIAVSVDIAYESNVQYLFCFFYAVIIILIKWMQNSMRYSTKIKVQPKI